MRIVNLVPSSWIRVNWDTGNSYLAGVEDPYEGLEAVRNHVFHVHAKDIDMKQSEAERGKVTGTPVGCACGDGVVDWDRVISILEPLDRELFLSVECGTIDQADRSLHFLKKVLGAKMLA
jgi:sugar phosphate isomerase/epimerase